MNDNKNSRRPIIDPLLMVLKSRRVLVALTALLVGVLVSAYPVLEPVQTELIVLVVTLALALIGGYSVEDAAHAARERSTQPPTPDDLHTLLKEAVNTVIDEAHREQTETEQEQPRRSR
jgi:hypothetical protein